MQRDTQSAALQTIFSFFLGLMVLAFVGIGVNTFYPQPKVYQEQMDKLFEQQNQIDRASGKAGLTVAQQAESKRIQDRISVLQKKQDAVMRIWARNTSIVLIVFATLVMGISLVRSEQLRVLSNGLLLGGLFTMVYGVGWVLFSGESVARFVVIVFAFAITVALGYLKFVRGRQVAPAPAATMAEADDVALASLSARIEALEARTAAAAAALGERGGDVGRDA